MKLEFTNVYVMGSLASRVESLNSRLLSQSLNRAMGPERTAARRAVAKETGASYGRVAKVLGSQAASSSRLAYTIRARDSYMPLSDFKAREAHRGGVTAKPWGKLQTFEGAFMKAGALGNRVEVPTFGGQVFRRASKSRLPIVRMWGPSIPSELLREHGAPLAGWHHAVVDLPPKIAAELKRRALVGI